MTSRVRRPRPPLPPGMALPLTLLGIIVGGYVVLVATWVAAHVASGPEHAAPGFGTALVEALSRGGLSGLIGTDGSRLMFWLVFIAVVTPVLAVAGVVVFVTITRLGRAGTPAGSLGRVRDYRDMVGKTAIARAKQLRPDLPATADLKGGDVGLAVGRLMRTTLYASHEDVILEICGPRSNKTSALVVPAVLTAPGPVIATSNKVDAWTLTSGLRARVGRVFCLDPQHIARVPQTWWCNLLDGITDMADAARLAAHFIGTVDGERADPYFTRAAARLLAQLILAAARAGRTLRDVMDWLATRSDEPVTLLNDHQFRAVATAVQATLEAPPDQRGGIFETALTAMGCLEAEAVARYVTPPDTWAQLPEDLGSIVRLDPWRFLVGYTTDDDGTPQPHDTLYLLTKEGAGAAAPVVAALVDRIFTTASDAAAARGGRVEPPLRAILDEAANICPIKNLPDLYSYFGSQSIQAVTILQSYRQGAAVWGDHGMAKLWGAATVKLIGAGVHDPNLTEDLSRLVGEHDVAHISVQSGRGGSQTWSTQRERILTAADIAALPKTNAVLLATGVRPTLIDLRPWYREDDADEITAYANRAEQEVRTAAVAALGPDNPLSRVLAAQNEPR